MEIEQALNLLPNVANGDSIKKSTALNRTSITVTMTSIYGSRTVNVPTRSFDDIDSIFQPPVPPDEVACNEQKKNSPSLEGSTILTTSLESFPSMVKAAEEPTTLVSMKPEVEKSAVVESEEVADEVEDVDEATLQARELWMDGKKVFLSNEPKRFSIALGLFHKALAMAPERWHLRQSVLVSQAACHFKLGRYTDTIAVCDRALHALTDSPSVFAKLSLNLQRARARLKIGSVSIAIEILTSLLETPISASHTAHLDTNDDMAAVSDIRTEAKLVLKAAQKAENFFKRIHNYDKLSSYNAVEAAALLQACRDASEICPCSRLIHTAQTRALCQLRRWEEAKTYAECTALSSEILNADASTYPDGSPSFPASLKTVPTVQKLALKPKVHTFHIPNNNSGSTGDTTSGKTTFRVLHDVVINIEGVGDAMLLMGPMLAREYITAIANCEHARTCCGAMMLKTAMILNRLNKRLAAEVFPRQAQNNLAGSGTAISGHPPLQPSRPMAPSPSSSSSRFAGKNNNATNTRAKNTESPTADYPLVETTSATTTTTTTTTSISTTTPTPVIPPPTNTNNNNNNINTHAISSHAVWSWLAEYSVLTRTMTEGKRAADGMFEKKQYDAAIEKYKELTTLDTGSSFPRWCAVLHCNIGAALISSKKYAEALSVCRKALVCDPGHPKAYLRIARAHGALDQFDDSITSYNTYIGILASETRKAVVAASSAARRDEGNRVKDNLGDENISRNLESEAETAKDLESDARTELAALTTRRREKEAREARIRMQQEQYRQQQQQQQQQYRQQQQQWFRESHERDRANYDFLFGRGANRPTGSGGFGSNSSGRRDSDQSSRNYNSYTNLPPPPPPPPPPNSKRGVVPSLYTVLDIAPTATVKDIKAAYRKLALQFHPDKNSDPAGADRFKEIANAYSILSDKSSKDIYDMQNGFARRFSFGL